MSYYLATHQDSGHELFSHRDDAKRWVEYQADYHRQEIGKWITHGEEESLRLTDGKTYVGTVRSMTLDKRAEHRQYEAEQRAERKDREAAKAAEAVEAERLQAQVAEQTIADIRKRAEQAEADLAEVTQARQHGAFTFCEQQVGHVTVAAFARKISEKRAALGQREEAVRYANKQRRRAEQAEAAIERVLSPAGIRAAAEAIGDEALTHLGRDLGTIHVERIAEAGLRAALDQPQQPTTTPTEGSA